MFGRDITVVTVYGEGMFEFGRDLTVLIVWTVKGCLNLAETLLELEELIDSEPLRNKETTKPGL